MCGKAARVAPRLSVVVVGAKSNERRLKNHFSTSSSPPRIMARVALLFLAIVATAAATPSWPMFRRSALHDAFSPLEGPTTNATQWTHQLGGPVYGSAILANGVVYVGTYVKPKGTMNALDAVTGTSKWQFVAGGPIGSTPCYIDSLSLVVFGA